LKAYEDLFNQNEMIKWEVYVPTDYHPDNPPGVMVYVSPQDIIKTPSGWMNIMEENNLIWIAATQSGNEIMSGRRILMSIMALQVIREKYSTNTDRAYISGFSGGGRIASIVSGQFPSIFNGSIYICGANFWDDQFPAQLDLIRNNRFVFMTGTLDFNLEDTKSVYRKYKNVEVNEIKLMVINRMGHKNPKKQKFAQAIQFLDEGKTIN
jgi:predicted esterase